MSMRPKPILLMILDGWGYSENTENNAVIRAHTPVWDKLWATCPHTLIKASGADVGLPGGQMGNSEVGHLNIGAGRVVYQEFTRVSRSIKTGSFFQNNTLVSAIKAAIEKDKAVHILGLLSPGGVHSHEEHIHAMVKLAVQEGATKVYLHGFLDGRDTAPKSAESSIHLMEAIFDKLQCGRFASIIGRYYAMDRDHRWDRIKSAYDLMTQGLAQYHADTALEGLQLAYQRDETDEFVKATQIGEKVCIEDGDVIFFMNYRSDRARQITRPFIDNDFQCFLCEKKPALSAFVSLTEYSANFDIPVAFPAERFKNVLGEYLSTLGLHQLRIAETEKYAHVTFFMNGGRDEPFPFEDRILVNSPHVATYDLQPEMSAPEVTRKLVDAIESGTYDVIICNYANPDMVGHTGNFIATIKALEKLDSYVGEVIEAIRAVGGEALITADHGNAEMMRNPETQQAHTAHTSNPVPLIYIGREHCEIENTGSLSDLAPTILYLMDLKIPAEMNGQALIHFASSDKA